MQRSSRTRRWAPRQATLANLARARPLVAMRALRNLFADPDDTKQVFKIIEALQGPALGRTRERLRQSETGRALLHQRPDLLTVLCDRERLAALPPDTLGQAYLEFVDAEGITADGLVAASRVYHPIADPEYAWIRNWMRDTHDLWHVVLGYRGDLIGEAALLAFSYVESGNWGVGLIAAIAWVKFGRVLDPRLRARAHILHGRRLAQRARWFIDVPWHEWLERPLDEVRRDLGVERPVTYTPVRSHAVDDSLLGKRPARAPMS